MSLSPTPRIGLSATNVTGPAPTVTNPALAERHARLRETAEQLEGVFVEQLFKAMRATIPQEGGIVEAGTGEEMFTALLDQHLAADTPKRWERGLSEALYRQLRRGLAGGAPVPASDATAPAPLATDRLPDSR